MPVEVDLPQATEPIPFAEIDTNLFDDDSPVKEPPTRPATGEYASPMFMKRSRASYGPLFELDLDDELEEDGGRRGKGRKRPRYSVQNRMWRFREGSSSPEPDIFEHSPSPPPAQKGDVEMKDTPAISNATEGLRQSNESELAPTPSNPFKTPAGSWNLAGTSSSVGAGWQQPSDAARIETNPTAFPPRLSTPVSDQHQEIATAQNSSDSSLMTSIDPSSGLPQVQASVHSDFGMPQGPNPIANQTFGQASSLFGIPSNNPLNQGFGQAPSPFGGASNGLPNQAFGQAPSLFGTAPATTPSAFSQATSGNSSIQGFGQASSLFGNVSNKPLNQGFGQVSSLFGTGPAPAPPSFGPPSSSLRFSIGQEPQNPFGAPAVAPPQPPTQQYEAHDYPESYLDHGETSNHASPAAEHSLSGHSQSFQYDHGLATNDGHNVLNSSTAEQGGSWLAGPQAVNPGHANVGTGATEDTPSEESGPQATPPGMIPPHVEDGTRNTDEMQREGLLSKPVFRQDVPQAALPAAEHASAGEDEDSLSSEGQAYDENEKGDDYDLRNYDRVSDDEEGFDEGRPLPDGELLDDDEDQFEGEEVDFEEDDYDEDEYDEEDGEEGFNLPGPYPSAPQWQPQPVPQPPPPASVQKQPIVIDLLSDSDDDEPPAVQNRSQQHAPEKVKYESEEDHGDPIGQESQLFAAHERQQEDFRSQHEESDEEMVDNPGEDAEYFSEDDEYDSNEDELDGSERVDESQGSNLRQDDSSVIDASITFGTINSVAEVEEASTTGSGHMHDSAESFSEEIIEDEVHDEITAVSKRHEMQEAIHSTDGAMDLDEERHDDLAGSCQSQPAEMLASFETQPGAATNIPPSQEHDASHAYVNGDLPEQVKGGMAQDAQDFASQTGTADEGSEGNLASQQADDVIELFDEDSEDGAEDETGAADEVDVLELRDAEALENERLDRPSSPPKSQHREGHAGSEVDTLMTTVTTVTSHSEMQSSDQQQIVLETQDTEVVFKQFERTVADHPSAVQEADAEMVDAGATDEVEGSPEQVDDARLAQAQGEDKVDESQDSDLPKAEPDQVEGAQLAQAQHEEKDDESQASDLPEVEPEPIEAEPEQVEDARLPQGQHEDKVNEAQNPDVPEAEPESAEDENDSYSSPQEQVEQEMDDLVVNKRRSIFTQIDGTNSDGDEEFQPEDAKSYAKSSPDPIQGTDTSFASVDSQGSDAENNGDAEMTPQRKPKRGGRKSRATSSAKSTKSATVSKRAQRQPSSQQAPGSQRATRSKTMSFHQAVSPKENDEDLSIQLARAAMKSPSKAPAKAPAKTSAKAPTKTKRKVSAVTAKRLTTGLNKRLDSDMPDCAPLKDLKKYNSHKVDVAAVATSARTAPKRTSTREYASSFTITDPSLVPDGAVAEVSLYSLHIDHLPVVKAGDAVLLRGFTVVSLAGRGFGLKSGKDDSSWAVFEDDSEAEPQTPAAPVEMNDKETKYMHDLQAWYTVLDDGVREKLGKAVRGMIESGRESRAKK